MYYLKQLMKNIKTKHRNINTCHSTELRVMFPVSSFFIFQFSPVRMWYLCIEKDLKIELIREHPLINLIRCFSFLPPFSCPVQLICQNFIFSKLFFPPLYTSCSLVFQPLSDQRPQVPFLSV